MNKLDEMTVDDFEDEIIDFFLGLDSDFVKEVFFCKKIRKMKGVKIRDYFKITFTKTSRFLYIFMMGLGCSPIPHRKKKEESSDESDSDISDWSIIFFILQNILWSIKRMRLLLNKFVL